MNSERKQALGVSVRLGVIPQIRSPLQVEAKSAFALGFDGILDHCMIVRPM